MFRYIFSLFIIFILLNSNYGKGEEGIVIESKIIKQEINKEEINRIKIKVAELEKNQKYILEFLAQKGGSNQRATLDGDIKASIDQIILSQREIYTKLESIEKEAKRYLLLQSIIQFIIFAIFFVYIIFLYRYKKNAVAIENKLDNVSSKIEDNKRETLKLLVEKAKDDPKLALAVKNLLEEERNKM